MFSRKKKQQEEPTDEAIDDEENEESYVDEPVEIDEEGQVGREPEIVVDDNDGGIDNDDGINGDNINDDIINGDMNNNDDDDDTRDVNVPPATTEDATEYDDDGAPPPPPPPLDDYDGERVLDERDLDERDLDDDDYGNVGNDDDYDYDDDVPQRNSSRKKKLAIAAVGLAMVASLGIGLGVGLGNGSKDAASESNAGSSGASGLDEVTAAGADADGVDDVDANVNGEEVDLKGGEEDALTETDSAAEMPASNGEEMEDEEASEDFDYDDDDDDDDDYDAATTTVATETPVVESEDQGRDEVTTATTEATQPSLAEEDGTTEDYVEYDDGDGGTAAADANETETVAAEEPEVLPMALQSEYDAVIIGAGWAGIRALETFLNNGVESVLVLEAADYVGGRSKSVNFQNDNDDDDDSISINDASKVGDETNVPYDVGGGWLYGEGSAQDDVLMEMGFLDPVLGNDMYTAVPLQTGVFYQQARDEDSGELTAEVLEDGEDWMEEIWGGFLQWRGDRGDDLEGESYADAIDQYWDDWGWTDDESLQFLNLVEDVMETEYTAESSQLGVREVNFFPPGYTIMSHYTGVPGMGFGNVAAEYAKPFEDRISLNSKVTEINSVPFMDGSGDTVVKYERNGEVGEVAAKTVLVTASLGVLKAGNIDFVPTIPGWKQEVIDEMGFGTTNKCIMTWDDDDALVWPADKLWFLLMTPEDETSGLWTQFYNPSKFKGKPSLVSWVGGDEVVEEERKSDEEILERVMANLRSMFPDIRDPDNVVVSRWGQEENVRGSYTFPVPGRDINSDARDLSRRIAKIWFAGEATGNGWGTTNGAWKTGEDQALRMVEDLQEDV